MKYLALACYDLGVEVHTFLHGSYFFACDAYSSYAMETQRHTKYVRVALAYNYLE